MKVFITFGQKHVHSHGGNTFDKDSIAVIHCGDYEQGRQLAFEYFEDKWHNCYSEDEWDPNLIDKYYPRGYIAANQPICPVSR